MKIYLSTNCDLKLFWPQVVASCDTPNMTSEHSQNIPQENTPRTIVMCLAFLVRNPHQLGKLLFEIDTVLKDKRVPDIDDLDRLKYTEMVIVLRETYTAFC